MKHVGITPVRIGNFPKAGYLCRVSELIKYCRVDFGPLTERNQPRDRVEILSDGRFAVFHGIQALIGEGGIPRSASCLERYIG
ncbi:hypothetical protein QCM77_01945 [Bradyrhizobium sp. SSUT18]|uniref:hypothetical protein n=1 Tax=Bradyrhizobium sp. SSUT18 TaxID=3040602 RepID=UPI00244C9AA3|nr:hypothetical protein [Bradyrhizobium sp. SSUT18]MDH2398750.1 hypothetical protein [Bradyrhizobium sp. SSUT18]